MLLTGTFPRAIDEKLRIAIPRRLREALGDPPPGYLYLTPGTDSSLALYTEGVLEALGQRLAGGSPVDHDVRAYGRLFYSRAERAELDAQGRIRVPPQLAALAGLRKEAYLIGVLDHLELWDKERWEAYQADKAARFDEIAEAAFDKPKSA